MADVRSWRRRKPGSHTRETIVQEKMPAEVADALARMAEEISDLQARIGRIETFIEAVSAEYRKRAEAA